MAKVPIRTSATSTGVTNPRQIRTAAVSRRAPSNLP
jgi:hypothetical protein